MNHLSTLQDLENNIQKEIANVTLAMLVRVMAGIGFSVYEERFLFDLIFQTKQNNTKDYLIRTMGFIKF